MCFGGFVAKIDFLDRTQILTLKIIFMESKKKNIIVKTMVLDEEDLKKGDNKIVIDLDDYKTEDKNDKSEKDKARKITISIQMD